MFLWAKLMLGILQWQTTEDDIRDSLRNAPEAIDDMITEMMKVYSSLLKGREADEFNTILAWVSCAIRPLTLAEVDAALRRLSPSASRVLALEQKCREKYASLIDLVRDDGLSTASLQSNYKPISINSIPETTRVVFAHASIAEYFKNDPGKFAKWKTATPVGIRRAEAQYNIFKTCLEIFVSPGEGAWREASRALQTYAKATWMKHIHILCSETDYARSESPSAYGDLLHLLYAFLNKESAVRLWCRDLPWQSYTEVSAVMIAECIEIWAQYIPHESSSLLQQWVTDTKENPPIVFVQIARVNLHESLHGDWYPFQSLAVVAQIKALVEGDDTLDCAPNQGKLSMNVIASALAWFTIEPNASWHRNVAICYRRSGHISKAIEHFQRALDLDPELVEARGGLAIAYQEQGYHTKAIDLELINAKILHKRIATAELRDQDDTRSRQELSTSYETIAHDYWMLQDKMQALKYWRRAVATGHIRDKTLRDYFTVLAGVQDESRWQEVLHVLRILHESQDATGQNRLTKYIHRESWPYEEPPEFFYMAATAARETSCLSFLIEAYRAAIVSAASTSHLSVLILQLALVKLYKNYQYNFVEIEPLMDEIIQVVSIQHDPKIRELEDCKENLARDYCQMCIRKAIAACNAGRVNSQYTHKVEALFKSGVFPYDITAKVIFREKTHLYLALLERVTGSLEDAAHILRPYMQQCCSMRAESQTRNIAGLRYLAVSLLALGQIDDFLPLASFVFVTFGWRCDICGKRASPPNKAVICQHCLDFICQRCLAERETGRVIRFCSPGHHVLAIEPSFFLDEGRMVLFRGSRKCVEDCVALVKQKWGLYEETSQS
jgi:tetratricopeptide (TPR) repeat protein